MPRLPSHFASAFAAVALAVMSISSVVSVPHSQAAAVVSAPILA